MNVHLCYEVLMVSFKRAQCVEMKLLKTVNKKKLLVHITKNASSKFNAPTSV